MLACAGTHQRRETVILQHRLAHVRSESGDRERQIGVRCDCVVELRGGERRKCEEKRDGETENERLLERGCQVQPLVFDPGWRPDHPVVCGGGGRCTLRLPSSSLYNVENYRSTSFRI